MTLQLGDTDRNRTGLVQLGDTDRNGTGLGWYSWVTQTGTEQDSAGTAG